MHDGTPAYLNDRLSLSFDAQLDLDALELRLTWSARVDPDEGGAWDLLRWLARWSLGQQTGSVTLHGADLDGYREPVALRPDHLRTAQLDTSFRDRQAQLQLSVTVLALGPVGLAGPDQLAPWLRQRGWLPALPGDYHAVVLTCTS
jgi:hypothetical protein